MCEQSSPQKVKSVRTQRWPEPGGVLKCAWPSDGSLALGLSSFELTLEVKGPLGIWDRRQRASEHQRWGLEET